MKTSFSRKRLAVCSLLVVGLIHSISCVNTYDGYGRPVQTVDPAVAIAGIAAAGILGYAAANSSHHHYENDNYYRRSYRHDGYYPRDYHPDCGPHYYGPHY